MAATGIILLVAAANTALNGMWSLTAMDEFSSEWNRRLQSAADAAPKSPDAAPLPVPTQSEIFESLNGHVGHHLSRIILSSLGVQGIGGIALIIGAFVSRSKPAHEHPEATQ